MYTPYTERWVDTAPITRAPVTNLFHLEIKFEKKAQSVIARSLLVFLSHPFHIGITGRGLFRPLACIRYR